MQSEQLNSEKIDILIQAYLNETISEEETFQLLNWVQMNPENKKYFQDYCAIWHGASEYGSLDLFDAKDAFNKFLSVIGHSDKIQAAGKKGKSLIFRISVAASIVMLLGIVILSSLKIDTRVITAKNNIVRDTLPDGTIATLNKNSSLTYSRNLLSSARNVNMRGEIFFKVAKEQGIPFLVNFDHYGVRVVGTSFNISMAKKKSEVSVYEGIVEVFTKKGFFRRKTDEVMLHKNERLVLDEKKSSRGIQKANINSLAWERGMFVFENTSLEEVVHDLNAFYGTKISIEDDSLKRLRLNAKLETNNLEMIFKVLSLTFDVNIDKKGDSYSMRPNKD